MLTEEKINISNAGTVAKKINIEAKQVAGRDLFHFETKEITMSSRMGFAEVDNSAYSDDYYTPPNFTSDVIKKIFTHRILILSGGQGFDKGSFVRHLSHKLKLNEPELTINEQQNSADDLNLHKHFLQEKGSTIYVLDQLHPKHLDYDLNKFVRVAEQKKLYLLITTDLSADTWGLSESNLNQYFFIIPTTDVYAPDALAMCLNKGLIAKKNLLKKHLTFEDNNEFDLQGVYDIPLLELAVKLKTPENINLFVTLLLKEAENNPTTCVDNVINEVINSSQPLVAKWFRTLDNKQKLLALGVSLLDGAYDDQYFSLMKKVIGKFWKHSDPSLLALDYVDLEFLFDYFRFESIDGGRQIVRNRFPNQRIDLIKIAWTSHRRHILAVLPVLVAGVNESVNDKTSDWELYGTRQRQMNIRSFISRTIADLGLVSIPAIENSLIELAAQNNETLQRVAAKALAGWREFDEDERLFSVLNSWLSDGRIQFLITEFLSKRDNDNEIQIGPNASAYLKATVVLTLSYAANYDSPNHLHQSIVHLITELAKANDSLVRSRLRGALPKIIQHHAVQLKNLLANELVRFDDLEESIGLGLAWAYKNYPQDIKSILYDWLNNCVETASDLNNRKKFTFRDKVLIMVFKTLQKIEFRSTEDAVTIDAAFQWLIKFNKQEKRVSVRKNLLDTVGQIMSLDWGKAEKYLPEFFTPNNLSEANIIVMRFVKIYIEQRELLGGAKYQFRWNDRIVPIWLSPNERPLTKIEVIMLKWMDSGDITLKQMATLSFLEFAKVFEEDELEYIEGLKFKLQEERINSNHIFREQIVSQKPVEPAISIWIRIYIFLLLLFEPRQSKITLKAIFKLLYRNPSFSRTHLNIVYGKWLRSKDRTTQKLANWMKRLMR